MSIKPIQRLPLYTGGTNASDLVGIKENFGLVNHQLLDVNANGEINNVNCDNIEANTIFLDNVNIEKLIGGTDKILSTHMVQDSDTYTTTNTSIYAASAQVFGNYAPSSPTSKLFIMSSSYVENNGDLWKSCRARMEWWDGGNYYGSSSTSTPGLIRQRFNGTYMRWNLNLHDVFLPSDRRTDTGNWYIRMKYDSYIGGTTSFYRSNFLAIEFEER